MEVQETVQMPVSVFAVCQGCGNKFTVNRDTAIFKKEFMVNGQSIFLTYYDCPECGRRHYVQIDNARSLEVLKDATRQMTRLMVLRRKGKTVPQKQSVKFKKTREHLAQIRMELMKQYTGKLVHDSETDTNFRLEFSV